MGGGVTPKSAIIDFYAVLSVGIVENRGKGVCGPNWEGRRMMDLQRPHLAWSSHHTHYICSHLSHFLLAKSLNSSYLFAQNQHNTGHIKKKHFVQICEAERKEANKKFESLDGWGAVQLISSSPSHQPIKSIRSRPQLGSGRSHSCCFIIELIITFGQHVAWFWKV